MGSSLVNFDTHVCMAGQ